MNDYKKSGAIGKLLTGVLGLGAVAVLALLYYTEMIPLKYLIAAGAGLLVLLAVVGILTWNVHHKGRFLIGLLLWFAAVAGLVFGGMYVYRTRSTLSGITGVETEITQMGVYVKADNTAQDLQGTAQGTYGILKTQDRTVTDMAVQDVKEQLGQEITVEELVEGLFNGETQAVILNTGFLDIARDSEDYPDLDSKIREVSMNNVETEVEKDEEEKTEEKIPLSEQNVFIVDISGIDSRGGLVAKSRSDVNILAIANTDTKQKTLLL